MLQVPGWGQKVFEVALYNAEVRTLVKQNRSHSEYEDHWADTQVRDVVATDEAEAKALIEERYPEAKGFVIDDVSPSRF